MSSAPKRDYSGIPNPGRERTLARIKKALATAKKADHTVERRPVFPPVGDDLLARFQAECKANLTECVVCDGDVREKLAQVLAQVAAGEIFAEDTPPFRELLAGIDREVKWSSEGRVPECAQATITTAEALIAQTGSVVVSSGHGGRGASVVAPVHIVIAKEKQLVTDISAALQRVQAEHMPQKLSFVGLVTGCSRTGDIEKLLVIGAHGPKRVAVLIEKE